MATTLETYYAPSDIASDPTKLIKIYDSVNSSESALAIQVDNSESAWWVNSKGERYLVWQKQMVEVGQYYFWGVQGDFNEDTEEVEGDIVTLTEQILVDGISEADIISSAIPANLRMTKTHVGEIINNENLTPINGYIVVISDGNRPGLSNQSNADLSKSFEKVKVFTDVNGKQHTVWCFPLRSSGYSTSKVKNLEIK